MLLRFELIAFRRLLRRAAPTSTVIRLVSYMYLEGISICKKPGIRIPGYISRTATATAAARAVRSVRARARGRYIEVPSGTIILVPRWQVHDCTSKYFTKIIYLYYLFDFYFLFFTAVGMPS